ncbi:MAG: glycoside hydrolase family 38 C-terminal domain-containing protein [Kiritimatiellia bacterium]|nr:glycoside hydrolase family 38 C-terminal domain-containing protein [Kiritimatiellia bacterium]
MKAARRKAKAVPGTLHLVCNAHLDPVWLWEWEEGAAEALSTFRAAADLCEEFDEFIFNHNEALLYQWIEEYDPPLFNRIRHLVQQGRWHIMGGWFLQPDGNLPSGEALLRQAKAGREYFKDRFGVAPRVLTHFDCFGHSRGMVTVLRETGYEGYLFCRPNPGDLKLPANIFRWLGFDGREVTGIRMLDHYNSPLGKAREKVEKRLAAGAGDEPQVVLWGVGNHGGGPSRQDLRSLARLMRESPTPIRHSTPEAFLDDLLESGVSRPIHADDLNLWAPGCYTSQIRIKQTYRLLENAFFLTEKMCAAACAAGRMAVPKMDLKAAERDLLIGQFHDILPGTSIRAAETSSLQMMQHGLELLRRIRARAFFALSSGQPRIRKGRIPLLVFNPHPYPVTTRVCCEFQLPDQNFGDDWTVPVVTRNGIDLPTNLEQEDSLLNLDWRKRVIFRATLPAGVMSRFDVRLERRATRPRPSGNVRAASLHVKTADLDVRINPRTGLLDRLEIGGVAQLKTGAARLWVCRDTADPWGMNQKSFRDRVGSFKRATRAQAAELCGVEARELAPIRIVEDGPVRKVIEATFVYNRSHAHLRYEIPKQGTEVGLGVTVHWAEADRMLKLSLPTTMPQAEYRGEVAFGVQSLPVDGTEAVAHRWVAAVDPLRDQAFSVINSGTYGSDFRNGEIRISLLRSAAYAAHPIPGRELLPGDRWIPRIDQGVRSFHFTLNAGHAETHLASLNRAADVVSQPPMALPFCPDGQGKIPKPFLRLRDDSIVCSAVEPDALAGRWRVRLFNPTSQTRRCIVEFPALRKRMSWTFSAFELKEFLVGP